MQIQYQTEPLITSRRRKILIDKIAYLNDTEHVEIFKMIKDSNISFTQNRNGIFLNFKLIPDETVLQVEKFVEFCNSNRDDLDKYDKHINECKLHKDVSSVMSYNKLNSTEPFNTTAHNQTSCNLQDVISREKKLHEDKTSFIDILRENKEKDRVCQYVDALEVNYAKIHKKKMCNMKYSNAKKKYSRKVTGDKKVEVDLVSNLEPEL